MATGCFYCDEHHEGREAIMFKVGDMKAGTLYLFKDQAHKGRCALALKSHKKELCECDAQERTDFAEDLARASGAIKKLWGCTKLNLGSFGDTNPHLHFHIVPKYEGGFEFGGSFAITNPEPVYLEQAEYDGHLRRYRWIPGDSQNNEQKARPMGPRLFCAACRKDARASLRTVC